MKGAFIAAGMLAALAAGAAYLVLRSDAPAAAGTEESRATFFISRVLFEHDREHPQAARRRAWDAYEQIRRGTPLADVARAQSQDPSSQLAGGFVGVIPVYFAEGKSLHGAVQMLEEGQLGKPAYTGLGWEVLYRHPYEEGRQLERRWRLPLWGFTLTHREMEGGDPRSKEEALALARQLLQDLVRGTTTLGEAKARYAPAGRGRPDGWVQLLNRRTDNAPLFDALAALPEGAYAKEPLDAADGIAVFKRGRFYRGAVRHILVSHVGSSSHGADVRRLPNEAKALAERALAIVRSDLGRWDATVRSTSDDLATVDERGSLGCIATGEVPPEIEDALLSTPAGEVCPRVVETALGFHVLWRVD